MNAKQILGLFTDCLEEDFSEVRIQHLAYLLRNSRKFCASCHSPAPMTTHLATRMDRYAPPLYVFVVLKINTTPDNTHLIADSSPRVSLNFPGVARVSRIPRAFFAPGAVLGAGLAFSFSGPCPLVIPAGTFLGGSGGAQTL
jgi:hypothetical protein